MKELVAKDSKLFQIVTGSKEVDAEKVQLHIEDIQNKFHTAYISAKGQILDAKKQASMNLENFKNFNVNNFMQAQKNVSSLEKGLEDFKKVYKELGFTDELD